MTPPRLELRHIAKAFGDLAVLADVSLTARRGEFVSIVGPSGAGKSTIFNLLIGEFNADEGDLLFEGEPLIDNRSHFAFMPQRDALLPWTP
jgi:ABC-type nitrate/sulfonate/bicarbonate transport system ATPase subunit